MPKCTRSLTGKGGRKKKKREKYKKIDAVEKVSNKNPTLAIQSSPLTASTFPDSYCDTDF